jgi:hypothetical protein
VLLAVEKDDYALLCERALQGEPWPSAIKGHELDPFARQKEQQRILLERFQVEVSVAGDGV